MSEPLKRMQQDLDEIRRGVEQIERIRRRVLWMVALLCVEFLALIGIAVWRLA